MRSMFVRFWWALCVFGALASLLATPGLSAPTWKSTVFELDLYTDWVSSSDPPSLMHQSGYYPEEAAGGPESGQFWVESGDAAGLPMYGFVQDFIKIREMATVTYTFYPETILPIRTRAIYVLFAGDQIHQNWVGWEIAEIYIAFTDGSSLNPLNMPSLRLLAGDNIRNAISQIGTETCLTTETSADVECVWWETSAHPAWGIAYVDLLKISLPEDLDGQDYTLKQLESISFHSLRGAHTPYEGGPTWRPGLNLYGVTAPGFRPYPHGYYFENQGQNCNFLAEAYVPSDIRGDWETNFYFPLPDTFGGSGFPGAVQLNAAGNVNWAVNSNRIWAYLYGKLNRNGVVIRNAQSNIGVCYGLAATGLRWYNDGSSPPSYERIPNRTGNLLVETLLPGHPPGGDNQNLALYKWIIKLFFRQFNYSIRNDRVYQRANNDVRNQLDAMQTWMLENRPFVLDVWGVDAGQSWGHTVVPECVIQCDPPNNNVYYVYVWDNNWPAQSSPNDMLSYANKRRLVIDRSANTYTYQMGPTLENGTSVDSGRITLCRLDRIEGDGILHPDFVAWATSGFIITALSAAGSFGLTNDVGQRFGFVDGEGRDEIPGACPVVSFGVVDEIGSLPEVLSLPADDYDVSHTASTAGSYQFHVILPKGEILFDSTCEASGTDNINVTENGRDIVVSTPDALKTFDLEIACWAATGENAAFIYNLDDVEVGSDGTMVISVDDEFRELTVTNNGTSTRDMTITYTPGDGDDAGVPQEMGSYSVEASSSVEVGVSGWSSEGPLHGTGCIIMDSDGRLGWGVFTILGLGILVAAAWTLRRHRSARADSRA